MKAPALIPLAWLALAGAVMGQQSAPRGIFHARLLASSGTGQTGGLVFQPASGGTLHCSYDAETWFERDHERIFAPGLQPGERIEIVTDRKLSDDSCYARLVSVISPQPRYRRRPSMDLSSVLADRIVPVGDQTIAGVVACVGKDEVTIRTRAYRQVRVGIHAETRYVANGRTASAADLTPNMRVFIRGGTDLDGNLDAYQVVWGEILDPASPR